MIPSRVMSPPSRVKVLLIEDDRSVWEPLLMAMRNARFEVQTATDTTTTLVRINHHLPDAIVLDLDLPTGTEILTELSLRSIVPRVPVIVMTSTNWTAPAALVYAILRKPVAPEDLLGVFGRAAARTAP